MANGDLTNDCSSDRKNEVSSGTRESHVTRPRNGVSETGHGDVIPLWTQEWHDEPISDIKTHHILQRWRLFRERSVEPKIGGTVPLDTKERESISPPVHLRALIRK
jgi:hypothetical protein